MTLPDDVLRELDDLLAPADAALRRRLAGRAGRPGSRCTRSTCRPTGPAPTS